jgi:SAM-dependent methyltransferase
VRALIDAILDPLDDVRYRWREERLPESVAFDREYGTDTAGFSWIYDYEPTRPAVVEAFLDRLGLDWTQWSFVDLGCGKGRVVLLAARRPFRRVVGIEISSGMLAIAQKNLGRFQAQVPLAAPVHLVCGDVADCPLPDGNLLLYLFNPFSGAVLRRVLTRLGPDREALVVYLHPVYEDVLTARGWVETHREGEGVQEWRVYRRQ